MVGASSGIPITRPSTSIDLAIPQPKLRAAVADLERPGNVQLVLRDVTAQSHPGVLFDVYIAKKGDPTTRQHVGTISWFGAFRHHGTHGAEKRTLRYDITDELRALGTEAVGTAGVTVIVEATHGLQSSDRSITETESKEAAADFRPEANLKIGAIELRAVPAPPPALRVYDSILPVLPLLGPESINLIC